MRVSVVRRIGILAAALVLVAAGGRSLRAQTGTVQGRVADSTGAVIVGALFTIDQTGLRTTSTARGRYTLGGVPSGRRTLRIRALGFTPESLVVTVEASKVTDVDVVLSRSAYQ